MTLSGGIAAIAGVTEMFGKYHRFIEGFSPSFGFTGIAVAILGKNHPVGVILTALLFGMMDMGALRMSRETAVSSNTVSYTHLDVYKRQAEHGARQPLCP